MEQRCRKCEQVTRLVDADMYEVPKEKLGIRNVVVVGGAVKRHVCGNCGEVGVMIPDLPGLIAATAVARAKMPWKLAPEEIRFLRKAMELNAKDLAELLEVTPESVSRWENGKAVIGPSNEKLLRINVGLRLSERAPGVNFDQNEVANMKIQAAFVAETLPKLMFKRIQGINMAKQKPKEEEVWLKAA
jgi:putative zinc finger/helix-turn-helix YgiT family protein